MSLTLLNIQASSSPPHIVFIMPRTNKNFLLHLTNSWCAAVCREKKLYDIHVWFINIYDDISFSTQLVSFLLLAVRKAKAQQQKKIRKEI